MPLDGETGTGKGVIAKLIHRLSRRADGPFVEVNCGALPENLVESELYGYQPGAFTGSLRSGQKGLFELANGGTIFLDEISELPLMSQTKLLKFLDDKVIQRVLTAAGLEITVQDLPDHIRACCHQPAFEPMELEPLPKEECEPEHINLRERLEETERRASPTTSERTVRPLRPGATLRRSTPSWGNTPPVQTPPPSVPVFPVNADSRMIARSSRCVCVAPGCRAATN